MSVVKCVLSDHQSRNKILYFYRKLNDGAIEAKRANWGRITHLDPSKFLSQVTGVFSFPLSHFPPFLSDQLRTSYLKQKQKGRLTQGRVSCRGLILDFLSSPWQPDVDQGSFFPYYRKLWVRIRSFGMKVGGFSLTRGVRWQLPTGKGKPRQWWRSHAGNQIEGESTSTEGEEKSAYYCS